MCACSLPMPKWISLHQATLLFLGSKPHFYSNKDWFFFFSSCALMLHFNQSSFIAFISFGLCPHSKCPPLQWCGLLLHGDKGQPSVKASSSFACFTLNDWSQWLTNSVMPWGPECRMSLEIQIWGRDAAPCLAFDTFHIKTALQAMLHIILKPPCVKQLQLCP